MEKNVRDTISSDGIYLHLCVKDTENLQKSKRWWHVTWMSSVDPFSVKLFWRPTRISKIWGADARITDSEYGDPMGLLFGQKGNYYTE